MTVHKEGYRIIFFTLLLLIVINFGISFLIPLASIGMKVSIILSSIVFLLIVNFFRSPKRIATIQEGAVISPADGKVVVIEEVYEAEYLKTQCIQVSVFMSVFNVHINWFPIKGLVKYFRHHNGRFMAAYLPKSSTENERTTVVVEASNGKQILFRQVAGALARRIVCYAEEETQIDQGQQCGFIKFGSRIDLYFPLDAQIDVKIGQKVSGRQTILGWLK